MQEQRLFTTSQELQDVLTHVLGFSKGREVGQIVTYMKMENNELIAALYLPKQGNRLIGDRELRAYCDEIAVSLPEMWGYIITLRAAHS